MRFKKKGKPASSLHVFWLNRVAIIKMTPFVFNTNIQNLSELRVVNMSRMLGWSAGGERFHPNCFDKL